MYMIERATIDDIEKLVEIQVSAFANDRKQCGSG
ncbi:TPA: N-acetyltransferase, partial [Vibrio vulnificus]|nr:N-acetyltransferase [Vibrio vulnificus]